MQTMTATRHLHAHHPRRALHPVKWIADALAVRQQRQLLEELDDHMLRDIGIDRTTARAEAERQFWDLPR